jgi:hypothetical protein
VGKSPTSWRMARRVIRRRVTCRRPQLSRTFLCRCRRARRRCQAVTRAQDKYLKALEAPQMVGAFHQDGTLEIASGKGASRSTFGVNSGSNPTVTVHPPASVYTVIAGSVIPAVLVSGVNSDLPGPILAQVSENVADSASGKYLLVPQGSRLIGVYQNASNRSLDLPRIEFRRRVIRLTADAPFSRLHRPPATDGTASLRPFKSLTVRMLESGRASTT